MKKIYKMNVLQIADYNAPYRGNFIASLESLHYKLKQNGCIMVYLFPEKTRKQIWIQELLNENYNVYFYTDNIIKNYFLLKKIINKYNINILHVHFRNMKIALPVTLAHLTSKNTFYLTHMHGQYIKAGFIKELGRKISRFDSYYIACSTTVLNQLVEARVHKNKLFCVENGIDFTRLDKYDILTNDKFGLDDYTKKILMFGYNWHIKGVDLALKAIKDLYIEDKKVVLLITVAAYREDLEGYIRNTFGEIPNWLILLDPRNDIATYYKFADVFISPSRTEGLPYAVIEAAYCKVPLVVSDIPAQKNLKLLGNVLFETENINQLKILINEAINGRDNILLEKQKDIVVENYSLNRWTEDIFNIYRNVISLS